MESQISHYKGMREALLEWLVRIYDQYFPQYGTPMLFLANNIIYRFLCYCPVHTEKLKLLGIAALQIALKFENGTSAKLSKLENICKYKYTTNQILQAERFILGILDYRVAWPGPLSFLERTGKTKEESDLTKKVAGYILEATTVNPVYISKLPSLLAATAFFLAQSLL